MVTRHQTACRAGFYYRDLDLALRPELERTGRWKGRGIGIILDAVLCFAFAGNADDGLRKVVGAALHELCHWLDRTEPVETHAAPFDDWLAAGERRKKMEAEPQEFPLGFIGHDDTFIRLCCHVWYRANHHRDGGCALRPRYLAFGSDYPGLEMLDSPMDYISALGDELETYEELPLRNVAASAQPPAFADLWNATLTKMFSAAETAA